MHSTHNQRVLPWMSHWQTTIGSPNTAEKYRRPNRGNRFDNIEAVSKVTGRLVSNSYFNKNLTAIV